MDHSKVDSITNAKTCLGKKKYIYFWFLGRISAAIKKLIKITLFKIQGTNKVLSKFFISWYQNEKNI